MGIYIQSKPLNSMEENNIILEKWKDLIYAAKAYWIDSIPTGMDDSTFDSLERRALEEDGFSVRDYIFQTYLKGTRTENKYIEKIEKRKVEGMSMLDAIKLREQELGKKLYITGKFDGSSIAVYINPETGIPFREVTVGNQNLPTDTGSKTSTGWGVDQTWKLHKFIPRFPLGIVAVQCEALLDLNNLPEKTDPERARQQANAYINSVYLQDEIDKYLTLRVYRYYTDDTPNGVAIRNFDYKEILKSFQTVRNEWGIKFAPADVFTVEDLEENPELFSNTQQTTSTGKFLFDGTVLYDYSGQTIGALKFAGAGSESDGVIKTTVKSIKWTDQTPKGKDSWAANVVIDPVVVRGSTITKPSAGSVKKLVKNKISPGATVTIIMAQEVIPQIKDCISPGDGDYMFPKCSCGYQMSESDIYGSRLKCGNTRCSSRESRMSGYLKSLEYLSQLDLNKFLVIDGFKWEDTDIDLERILKLVEDSVNWKEDIDPDFYIQYRNYLMSYMNTDARKRNLDLVVLSSWITLREEYIRRVLGG